MSHLNDWGLGNCCLGLCVYKRVIVSVCTSLYMNLCILENECESMSECGCVIYLYKCVTVDVCLSMCVQLCECV